MPAGIIAVGLWLCTFSVAAEPLVVETNFEGGSARVAKINQDARQIELMPGGDPIRGWPCWWYVRVQGTVAKEKLTVIVRALEVPSEKPDGAPTKPLAIAWSTPNQATYSHDGEAWQHSQPGKRAADSITYEIIPEGKSIFIAWGPPYTPQTSAKFVKQASERCAAAKATELCKSREGRSVPLLYIREGDRPDAQRFGVWIQARQHAWESGASWVAQGVGEWLTSDHPDAAWLRQHAEIFLIPVMDIDNTAIGNGGKEAKPQDHNRDWSEKPHWHEVAAAQKMVGKLVDEGRMNLFIDLHNPSAGDPTFFFVSTDDLLKEPGIKLQARFLEFAHKHLGNIKPAILLNTKPRPSGAGYHPLWRQISTNWVNANGNPHTVAVCLETCWNSPRSTTEGYRAVGAAVAGSVREFLAELSARK